MSRSAKLPWRQALTLVLCVVLLLGTVRQLVAMATESFGNVPISPGWNFANGVVELANLPSRVYWYEVNGNPEFFFRGNTEALNEALRKFAAIKSELREVFLLPGSGYTFSLSGDKHIPYDWKLHAPHSFYLSIAKEEKGTKVMTKHPTMVIFVNLVAPASAVDEKQIARWADELGNDSFLIRQKATDELKKLGHAAGPALRKALGGQPSVETHRRLELLLADLQGINLDVLQLPTRISVLDFTDMRERFMQGLKSSDANIRGRAASSLASLEPYIDDVIPTLLEVLKTEKHEYARRSVAGAMAGLGQKAKAALPILKEGFQDPDVNVRKVFQQCCIAYPFMPNKEFWPDGKRAFQPCRLLCESGCGIHEKPRPTMCTDFSCEYARGTFGSDASRWRPDNCGVILEINVLYPLLQGNLTHLQSKGVLPPHWRDDEPGISIVEARRDALSGVDADKTRYGLRNRNWRVAVVVPYGLDLHIHRRRIKIDAQRRIGIWNGGDTDDWDRVSKWWN